jgi:hypothetical protein
MAGAFAITLYQDLKHGTDEWKVVAPWALFFIVCWLVELKWPDAFEGPRARMWRIRREARWDRRAAALNAFWKPRPQHKPLHIRRVYGRKR